MATSKHSNGASIALPGNPLIEGDLDSPLSIVDTLTRVSSLAEYVRFTTTAGDGGCDGLAMIMGLIGDTTATCAAACHAPVGRHVDQAMRPPRQ